MGRPPCCDKVGIKKGPWTPEEDIILVSYIQEHGPGNWRSVPTNTGLLRCSKSCRLRWTNYLRPGIKRGNFTPHEEGMIIHLQALLGNKWAAIASYLPQRTDNDIKNYWNTHLKKKIKKLQSAFEPQFPSSDASSYQYSCKSSSEKICNNLDPSTQGSSLRLNQAASTYASSTENISRLLEGWMRSSSSPKMNASKPNQNSSFNSSIGSSAVTAPLSHVLMKAEQEEGGCGGDDLASNEELESILSAGNMNGGLGWERPAAAAIDDEKKRRSETHHEPPLAFLENWLFGESSGQVEEIMELPPIF